MSAAGPLSPGTLADRLASLPVEIEDVRVDIGAVDVPGYYDGAARPRGVVVLSGAGAEGRGECVAWYVEDQAAFADAAPRLAPVGVPTVGLAADRLRAAADDPYHRSALEAAAIDLALRQGSTNLFVLAERPAEPVRYCWSIGASADPIRDLEALLRLRPDARVKVDCPAKGWSRRTWSKLADTGRVVVVDFKRKGRPRQVERAHEALPEAWLEDPPREALDDPDASWLGRVALDGWVASIADVEWPVLPPAAVNVKAPRVGGPLEALRILEVCERQGWHAYVGGMFEVDVGRAQARVLASLFTADAWNDLAPVPPNDTAPCPAPIDSDFTGFAPPIAAAGGGETGPGVPP